MKHRTSRITQEIPGKRLDDTRRTGKSGDRCNEWRHQHSRARQRHTLVVQQRQKKGSDIRERSKNSRLVQGHQMWEKVNPHSQRTQPSRISIACFIEST
ncbi:hypothetical protein TNIN_377721 [Trichonephila inaurata madagascariensis]|uniref:Uncharacterized protein n=1 Tax=Trichonephila inaurata madagascariensis TaxID=2747483 RepID=A0A8X7CHN0_9ARAC|nr:hypothetical protein TNIN_377721 [Trichonephila inaurata madagascariensis]